MSVLHLDMSDDLVEDQSAPGLLRHGSAGTVEDPGVIGPVVWNMHKERLQHGIQNGIASNVVPNLFLV